MMASLIKNRPWLAGICTVIGLLALIVAGAWLFRQALAARIADSWCRSNGLNCEFQIERLGFSGASVHGIRVRTETGEPPFEANEAEIVLNWDGLFSPRVTSVRLQDPVLRLQYTSEGKFELGGLEKIGAGRDSQGSMPSIPEITIKDARIEAHTPAGTVTLRGDLSGNLPLQAEVHARIEPADLRTDKGHLRLEEGRADFTLIAGQLRGSARLQISSAAFKALTAQEILLDVQMAQSLRPRVEFALGIGDVEAETFSAHALQLDGTASLRLGDEKEGEPGPLSYLRALSLSGTAGALRWQDVSSGQTSITLDTERARARKSAPQGLSGTFAVETASAISPWFSAEALTLSGEGLLSDELQHADLSGDLTATGATIPEETRASLLSGISVGPPFGAHAAALRRGLSAALSNFRTGTGYAFTRSPDAGWSIASSGNVAVTAENGAHLSLAPFDAVPALEVAETGFSMSGVLALDGTGLPDATAHLTRLETGGSGLQIETGGFTLKPWTVQGLSLSGDLNSFVYETGGDGPRIRAVGEATVSGDLFGQSFKPTKVFGGIEALIADSLRVQSFSTRCIGLDTQGFTTPQDLRVGAFTAQLCPPEGRLVRRAGGALTGSVSVDSLSFPFSTADTSGKLSLRAGKLDWRAARHAEIDITGSQMTARFDLGENTLQISAARPELDFALASPLEINARTGRTELSGSLIPADIELEALRFDATLPESGLSGTAAAQNVVIRDTHEDPFYQPLRGDFDAVFSNGLMQLSGPISTQRAGEIVADANMTLDLLELDGEASVETRDLVFEPGGLQPTALSEKVRGFLSNARGQLNAGAYFLIESGDVSGTGYVEVDEFGFDTLRVGAVNNVDGRVEFDSLLDLHTPPGQTVKLGEINPGLPLRDGEIHFQLLGPQSAVIEDAGWPFAGGRLEVGRSEWTIAGTSDIVEISARELELSEIIRIFNLPDIEAQGTVSGRFPVEFDGPNVLVRDAVLTADEEGGKIAYTGDVADAASQADERVDLAFRALRNFQFSVLEVGADGNLTGSIMITLRLVGVSPDVLGGAPFAFNIGVDSELAKLINASRRISGTDWLAEINEEDVSGLPSEDKETSKQAPPTPEP